MQPWGLGLICFSTKKGGRVAGFLIYFDCLLMLRQKSFAKFWVLVDKHFSQVSVTNFNDKSQNNETLLMEKLGSSGTLTAIFWSSSLLFPTTHTSLTKGSTAHAVPLRPRVGGTLPLCLGSPQDQDWISKRLQLTVIFLDWLISFPAIISNYSQEYIMELGIADFP